MACFAFLSLLTHDTPWWQLMAVHAVMSTAFAFVFTPLFTVALGSLPRPLYSHGSAVVGTIQQVAGAAGTALFVTVFSTMSDAALAQGLPDAAALLSGSHWAFLFAGGVWVLAVVASFFVRKPADVDGDLPVGVH